MVVGVLLKDVDAYIGSGAGPSAADNVTIAGCTQTNTLSTAKVRSLLTVTVGRLLLYGLGTTEAKLSRDVTLGGGVADRQFSQHRRIAG